MGAARTTPGMVVLWRAGRRHESRHRLGAAPRARAPDHGAHARAPVLPDPQCGIPDAPPGRATRLEARTARGAVAAFDRVSAGRFAAPRIPSDDPARAPSRAARARGRWTRHPSAEPARGAVDSAALSGRSIRALGCPATAAGPGGRSRARGQSAGRCRDCRSTWNTRYTRGRATGGVPRSWRAGSRCH